MRRKLIAVLLLAAMIVCMVPTEVFANRTSPVQNTGSRLPVRIYVNAYLEDTTTPVKGLQFKVRILKENTTDVILMEKAYEGITDDNGQVYIEVLRKDLVDANIYFNDEIEVIPDPESIGKYDKEDMTNVPAMFTLTGRTLRVVDEEGAEISDFKTTMGGNAYIHLRSTAGFTCTFYFTCYLHPTDVFTVYNSDGTPTFCICDPSTPFDATTLVSPDHLYAGLTTDAERTKLATGVNGKALTGKAGDTFYVREISDKYLQPASMAVRSRITGSVDQYMLTALDQAGVDNGFYTSYGFLDANKQQIGLDEAVAGDHDVIREDGQLYNTLQIVENGQTRASFTAEKQFNVGSDDYIGCVKMTGSSPAVLDTGTGVTFDFETSFTPYYVTHDGVLVTGSYTRYMNDVGVEEPTVADYETGSTASAYVAPPVSAPLRTKSVYRAADAPVSKNISSIDIPETPVKAPEEDVPTSFVRAILDEDCLYTADVTVTGAEAVFEDGYVCVNNVVVLDDSAIRQGHVYNGDIQAPGVPEGTIVQIAMYNITEDKQLLWCASVTYTCINGVLVSEVAE